MSEVAGYTVAPIQEEDVDEVMNLLKRTFFLDEPLNQTVGLCKSEYDPCPDLEEYCSHSLLEGLSFKAVDNKGKIIGVIVNGVCPLKEDAGNDLLNQAQICDNPKFKKILYILSRREEGARLWEKYPQDNQLLEIKVTATDPQWRRRGIMNVLVKETEEATKQRGIRLIRLDTSSAYSAMSAERLGYTCVYRAWYKDIKMDGQPLIVPEPPHEQDCVYMKELFK